MGKVIEDFANLFRPRAVVVETQQEDDLVNDAAQRVEAVRDMRVFLDTQAYKDFRAWIDREIEGMSPDPSMGSDVAACYTFKREGLIVSRRRLDTMVKLAQEKLSDA